MLIQERADVSAGRAFGWQSLYMLGVRSIYVSELECRRKSEVMLESTTFCFANQR